MVETLATTDAAVVLGSRYVAGGAVASDWPWHRKALSAWANFYVNAILRLRVKDATAGFKAWHADTLRAIDVDVGAEQRVRVPGRDELPHGAAAA